VSIVYFLKRLHNFALSLGWIGIPMVAPYLWPKYEAKSRRGIIRDEQESVLAIEKKTPGSTTLSGRRRHCHSDIPPATSTRASLSQA
jgi:hypothetical protein